MDTTRSTIRRRAPKDSTVAAVEANTTPRNCPTEVAEQWLSPEQIAARLNVSRATVLRLIKDGKLQVVKLSPQTWRVAPSELERFLSERAAT